MNWKYVKRIFSFLIFKNIVGFILTAITNMYSLTAVSVCVNFDGFSEIWQMSPNVLNLTMPIF